MDIEKLTYFISLAETLSFTKSAIANHVTQASMSRQIAALEKELGVKLFERNSRNVELTLEGKEFYWHAQSILNNYNYAVEQIANVERNKSIVRIGLGPYEHALAQPVIKKFTEQNPSVKISCLQYNYKNLVNYFRNGTVDVMFCINHYADDVPYKEIFDIYDDDWITLCSKKSPLLNISKPKLSNFNGQVFINLEAESDIERVKEANNLGFTPLYSIATNTLNSKIALTAAGVGITRVPKFLEQYIPDDVAILDCTYPSIRRFQCAYIKSMNQGSAISAFVEIVKEIYL